MEKIGLGGRLCRGRGRCGRGVFGGKMVEVELKKYK